MCFSAALSVDNKHLESLLACGNLYRSCMLLSEAVGMFRRAHEAHPDQSNIKTQLAESLTDLGTPSACARAKLRKL